MSTAYHAHIKLSPSIVGQMRAAIERNDYHKIQDLVAEHIQPIYIGTRAGGWKFLWNPYNEHLTGLTKDAIEQFIRREDIDVFDEYNKLQDKDEFLKMAFEWYRDDGYDSASYHKAYPDEIKCDLTIRQLELNKYLASRGFPEVNFNKSYLYDFSSDGLRFTIYD